MHGAWALNPCSARSFSPRIERCSIIGGDQGTMALPDGFACRRASTVVQASCLLAANGAPFQGHGRLFGRLSVRPAERIRGPLTACIQLESVGGPTMLLKRLGRSWLAGVSKRSVVWRFDLETSNAHGGGS